MSARAAAGVVGAVLAVLFAPVSAGAETVTFATPGEQAFTVPAAVSSVRVVAIGGRGGGAFSMSGGFGAQATGDLSVAPGQVLYVEVGGNGGDVSGMNAAGAGGANGGGAGAFGGGGSGGGGGGASDVRGLPVSAGSSLSSRLIIAAGGGGAGGGFAGGAAGADGAGAGGGKAGTSAAGGAAGGGSATAGGLGTGGGGGNAGGGTSGGGGGGGGLFGGGGGNGGASMSPGFGGGGGSTGFASGVTGASSVPDLSGKPSVTLSYVPTPPAIPAAVKDTVPPRVGFLTLSPSVFVAANTGPSVVAAAAVGTRVLYNVSEAAVVTFTVERAVRGVKRARRCVKRPARATRGAKPCTRYVPVPGSFVQAGTAGLNGLRFMGRLAGRSLPPGAYRLVATARDAAGNTSPFVRRPFRTVSG